MASDYIVFSDLFCVFSVIKREGPCDDISDESEGSHGSRDKAAERCVFHAFPCLLVSYFLRKCAFLNVFNFCSHVRTQVVEDQQLELCMWGKLRTHSLARVEDTSSHSTLR